MLLSQSQGEMYVRLMSHWQPEEGLVLDAASRRFQLRHWDAGRTAEVAMRMWDVRQYLPDDLLVKVDRASMSVSLETRAPMLDHRVVELGLALPQHMLVRQNVRKWALRQVLYRYVPQSLIDRPKSGFAVPLGAWLRGPLREWANGLLRPGLRGGSGMLDEGKVDAIWAEHLSGRFDRSGYIWNVLMFEAWYHSISSETAVRSK